MSNTNITRDKWLILLNRHFTQPRVNIRPTKTDAAPELDKRQFMRFSPIIDTPLAHPQALRQFFLVYKSVIDSS